mmetsp:Transcript_51287/g.100709  ORF Transcript_51287/g.100709 Transcript_51287/m.100709 type:complete len:210 (+) Transcript_51287:898-1527(+)
MHFACGGSLGTRTRDCPFSSHFCCCMAGGGSLQVLGSSGDLQLLLGAFLLLRLPQVQLHVLEPESSWGPRSEGPCGGRGSGGGGRLLLCLGSCDFLPAFLLCLLMGVVARRVGAVRPEFAGNRWVDVEARCSVVTVWPVFALQQANTLEQSEGKRTAGKEGRKQREKKREGERTLHILVGRRTFFAPLPSDEAPQAPPLAACASERKSQ